MVFDLLEVLEKQLLHGFRVSEVDKVDESVNLDLLHQSNQILLALLVHLAFSFCLHEIWIEITEHTLDKDSLA
jgi:hypothetical protein